MDPFTYFLAFTRLAPTQCVMSGHPVTTGIPTIDYYLTDADLDAADAQDRYTETLARLDAPSGYFKRPVLPAEAGSREVLGLPASGTLYVCPMMLFKFHPAFDAILAEILRRDRSGHLVLFQDRKAPHLHEALGERFARSMPDVCERVLFHAFAPPDEFLSILMCADVLLDTHPFGGGTTNYLAFATATSLVTLPGPDQRGRVAYSCYRQKGLDDCAADDFDDYVAIALRLGTDAAYRETIARAIRERSAVLYDNTVGANAIATFIESLPRAGGQGVS